MATLLTADELGELLGSLAAPGALIELAVLGVCLVAAAVVVRLIRGRTAPERSIWFGKHPFDGLMFPLVALAFALVARLALHATSHEAVFRLAVPILVSLVVIRLSVRVLGVAFPTARWVRIVERSISWLVWLAGVLWVTGVLPVAMDALGNVQWSMGGTRLSLRTVVEGLLTGALVMVIMLWISSAVEKRLLHGTGNALSLRKIAANLVRVVLISVGLLIALSAIGIDLTALSVLGGAVGVGVGLGLQKIASNYVSGFVVLAERALRIGDTVTVDGFEGRITDIRTRYTVIRAVGGRESIVPNEMLITKRVENASLADPKVAVVTEIQVAYGTDVHGLKPKMEAVVSVVSRVLADPGPTMQLAAFAADGLNLKMVFWIGDPENGQGNVISDVHFAILGLLNSEGIEIPFPQRVLHLPEAAAAALSSGSALSSASSTG